jgi:hypothetical protein
MDAIRNKMMYSSDGIPLGLITSHARFGDISFLLSHDFRAGVKGFKHKATGSLFGALIISCTLVAIFAGPSTALLLIPTYYTAWPGGGTSLWLNGDFQPGILDVSQSWDPRCTSLAHNISLLNDSDTSLSSCPWAGFKYLSDGLIQSVFNMGDRKYFYTDGISTRDFDLSAGLSTNESRHDAVRVFAVGNNIAAGAFALFIADIWCTAMWNAPQAAPGHRLANLHKRARGETIGSMEGPLPAVRTQCFNASKYEDTLAQLGLNINNFLPVSVST